MLRDHTRKQEIVGDKLTQLQHVDGAEMRQLVGGHWSLRSQNAVMQSVTAQALLFNVALSVSTDAR